ncbi:MAG: hypothetical protein P8179_17910 [Candidatus Thiodiazotropha sp.]
MIEAFGFHRSCIYEWMAKYEAGSNLQYLNNVEAFRQARCDMDLSMF